VKVYRIYICCFAAATTTTTTTTTIATTADSVGKVIVADVQRSRLLSLSIYIYTYMGSRWDRSTVVVVVALVVVVVSDGATYLIRNVRE
jgi:hypothetical protein